MAGKRAVGCALSGFAQAAGKRPPPDRRVVLSVRCIPLRSSPTAPRRPLRRTTHSRAASTVPGRQRGTKRRPARCSNSRSRRCHPTTSSSSCRRVISSPSNTQRQELSASLIQVGVGGASGCPVAARCVRFNSHGSLFAGNHWLTSSACCAVLCCVLLLGPIDRARQGIRNRLSSSSSSSWSRVQLRTGRCNATQMQPSCVAALVAKACPAAMLRPRRRYG